MGHPIDFSPCSENGTVRSEFEFFFPVCSMGDYPDTVEDALEAERELRELRQEVRRDMLKTYLRQELRWAIRHHEEEGETLRDFGIRRVHLDRFKRGEEITKLLAAERAEREDKKARKGWFITINPPERVSAPELWESCRRYLKASRSMEGSLMVIEQRSEDENLFKGWHVHMCVGFKKPMPWSKVKESMGTLISSLWTESEQEDGNFSSKWCVILPLGAYHRKYIDGDKHRTKMGKVHVDAVFRERYMFPPSLAFGQPEIIFPSEDIDHGDQEVHQEAGPSS